MRVGAVMRAIRLRRGWSQQRLAMEAGVSRKLVAACERGQFGRASLQRVRGLSATLDVRLELLPRWRGGELDRLVDAAHAALVERVVAMLRGVGWEVVPEASFSIYGERGSVDVLGWHAVARTVLAVEVKSRIVDMQALLIAIDRKRRLAARIAAERGWPSTRVGAWLAIADTRTNRRRLAQHAGTVRAALPEDGRALAAWLRRPDRAGSFATFLPNVTSGGPSAGSRGRQGPHRGAR